MIGWGVCVLALALADRYLLKRKDITHLELGDVEIKPGFIPFGDYGIEINIDGILDPRCSEADDCD